MNDFSTRRKRSGELLEAGRFGPAREILSELLERFGDRLADEDLASLEWDLALCLDREGDMAAADEHFARAARLEPGEVSPPPRLDDRAFEEIVATAIDSIPARFDPYLSQVSIVVRNYPGEESDDPFLLGLYVGVPRTERDIDEAGSLDLVFIYKRNHELEFSEPDELENEIQKTVIHEIGHHFGLEEHEMGEYA